MDASSLTYWQVGVQSFQDLSSAFWTTLWNGPSAAEAAALSSSSSLICGFDGTTSSTITNDMATTAVTTTMFYLDPWSDSTWTSPDNDNSVAFNCGGTDWVVIGILAVIIHTVSWGTRWTLWEPLANWRMKGTKTWNVDECRRFSMTCTACMDFTVSAFFANRILLHKPWLFRRNEWTVRGPIIDADYKFYYLIYAARFISDIVSLFFESRKVDAFVAALIHHVTTLGLVLGSALVGHTRYGGIIMFFFDWADIPLLCAKAAKYLSKHPKDAFQTTANRLFEIFAVLFFLTRNVYFNYIVFAAWRDLDGDWVNRFCQYLLLVLVGLQTYWMGLIVQAAVRISKNDGVVEDARDDDLKKQKKSQ